MSSCEFFSLFFIVRAGLSHPITGALAVPVPPESGGRSSCLLSRPSHFMWCFTGLSPQILEGRSCYCFTEEETEAQGGCDLLRTL